MTETQKSSGPPVIEMRGVSINALKNPDLIVTKGVEWTVQPGEFWVVAAPQHSGKTDFLMTAGGLLPPAGGAYYFLGEEMPIFEEPRLPHRLKLGFVFDGGQLFNQLTVAENVALPLRYHRDLPIPELEAQVRELLELMELTPWATSSPGTLGRSWQQRAGLARALALRPEVLLVDSPLTGLDARHTNWWLSFLDQLARGHHWLGAKPATLIVTADDLRPWRQHAGRVACLADEQLLVFGDWAAADKSPLPVVHELLQGEALAIDRNDKI